MFNIKSIKQTFHQVVKFCIVGSFGVFLNYSVFINKRILFLVSSKPISEIIKLMSKPERAPTNERRKGIIISRILI